MTSDLSAATIVGSEFIGTALLLLVGIGVSANVTLRTSFGHGKDWLLISIGWGMAVFVGASVSWRSGSHLNPAVTVALAMTGTISWDQVPWYVAAQVAGAYVGAWLAFLTYKKQFDHHDAPATTGGVFYTTAADRAYGWNVVTEAVGTFVLVYFVLQSSPFTPGTEDLPPQFGNSALGYAGIAFAVIAVGAGLGGPTGYAVNPARDLGPRLAYATLPIRGRGGCDWPYAWVPIVGPLAGAAVAAGAFLVAGG